MIRRNMGINIFLEVSSGDYFKIFCPDGSVAGKALVSLIELSSNCEHLYTKDAPETQWFNRLKDLSQVDLNTLSNALYSGNWDFEENEYDRFLNCAQDNPFRDEEEFKKGIEILQNKWTPIKVLIETVEKLLRVLPDMGEATHWFSPHDTILEFQGLLETLLLAKQRKGQEVRIKAE